MHYRGQPQLFDCEVPNSPPGNPLPAAACPPILIACQAPASTSIGYCCISGIKRCQEPFLCLLGLPRGRTLLSRPSFLTMRLLHAELPNGLPRARQLLSACCSRSFSGWLTCFSQSALRRTGQVGAAAFAQHLPHASATDYSTAMLLPYEPSWLSGRCVLHSGTP